MFFEVYLISIQHTVEPREELLRAVIRVQDNRNSVNGSDSTDVKGTGDSTSNASSLVLVVDTFACQLDS